MKVILQSVTVIDPTSAHHLKVVDIFVQDNLIKEIGKKLSVAGVKARLSKGISGLRENLDREYFLE